MASERVLECRVLRRRFGEIVAVDGVGFGVLAAYAAVLLTLAAWRLRRVLSD
jgi:hypothetical protein